MAIAGSNHLNQRIGPEDEAMVEETMVVETLKRGNDSEKEAGAYQKPTQNVRKNAGYLRIVMTMTMIEVTKKHILITYMTRMSSRPFYLKII